MNEDDMVAEIDRLVRVYGIEALESWTDKDKDKNHFIHWLSWKGSCKVLDYVCGFDREYVMNLDVQRESDGCTAAHLAVWYKRVVVYEKLLELGANPALENSYGHSAEDMLGFQAKYEEREAAKKQNLIFLDLEFTSGFYEFDKTPKILEAAIVITDGDLNELACGSWVVGGFAKEELEKLGDFHQTHFRDSCDGGLFPPLPGEEGGNGLFSDIISSSYTKRDVEQYMLNLVKQHCPANKCPLVGYSVQCDREVIQRQMPKFYRYLSHQIIDISSILRVAGSWAPETMNNREAKTSNYDHRAMNDVRDSIESMRWIRDGLFRDIV